MARSPLFTQSQPGGMVHVDNVAATQGNIWYVNSNAAGKGTTASYGYNPDAPWSTVAAALDSGNLASGDIVYVAAGHAETISAAAGWDCDTAGVSIVGQGWGTIKPTVTFGTATTADIDIDAANVVIRNIRFVNNIDSLAVMLDVNEEYFRCEDCDFVSSSTKEVVCFVDIATTKDWFWFNRCSFFQPTDPAGTDGNASTGVFYFVDSEHLFFDGCYFEGSFESAIWHNKTTAAKNVWIRNCYGRQELSGAEVFIQVAAMSGGIDNSLIIVPAATDVSEALVTGTLSDNFFVGVNAGFGNDGAVGQLAVPVAVAAA